MMARQTTAVVLGLLACQCGARSSVLDDSALAPVSPASPSSTPATVSPQSFADGFPEAFCALYDDCCQRAATGHARCVAHQRAWLDGLAKSGQAFDAGRATSCLAALHGWAGDHDLCLLRPDEQFAVCKNVYSPDPSERHPGESCEQDTQCSGQPRCALDESTGERVCQTDPGLDDVGSPLGPCRTDLPGVQAFTVDCAAHGGRTCSTTRDRCSYNHDLGQPCLVSDDCLAHLACDETGVCVPARVAGESCTSSAHDSLCGTDLDCVGGSCVLIQRARIGDACIGPSGYCDEGTCIDGTCRALDPSVAYECGQPTP